MQIQRFLHILNPNSQNRKDLKKFFKRNPRVLHVWVERTSHPTHLETIVEWGLLNKVTHMALWGGDGSFNRLVQALYEKGALDKTTLALLPVGTGNDFARKLELPSWKKALTTLFNSKGKVEKFDIGLLETKNSSRVFVNNAGFGRTPLALRRSRPNPFSDINSFTENKIEVECEDGSTRQYETLKAFLGIVFNSPYFNKGLYFDKQISPNDGRLNAVLVPPQNRWNLLLRFFRGRWGGSLGRKTDTWVEGQQIRIESDRLLYPQVDGEPVSQAGVSTIQFSVVEKALGLLVPKGAV